MCSTSQSPQAREPISSNAAYRRLKSLLREAGITENIPFHGLCHLFVTTALENGMDVKTLSTIIEYVSAKTTLNVYTHVTDAVR